MSGKLKESAMQLIMRHKLASVVVLALLLRVTILLAAGPSLFYFEQTGQIHGSTAYDDYAMNLLQTGIYGREAGIPDSNIPPLYSYVVAAIYALLGRSGLAIGLFHTLLDVLSIVLLYEIARRLFKRGQIAEQPIGEWLGLLAGLFYAAYPYLVFQNLTLNDTALYMLLMNTFILLVIVLREQRVTNRHTLFIALLAGLVLGIATLARALLPPFALLIALWYLFRLRFWEAVLRLLPVAIVSILVLLPWMIRSYGIYDAFVAVALNTGDNIFQGSNVMTVPLFRSGYDVQWSTPPPNATRNNPYLNNQILINAGLNYLQTYPERIPELLWVKFLVHWSVDITPRKNPQPGQIFVLDEAGNLQLVDAPDAQLQDIETLSQYDGGFFEEVARPIHRIYFGTLLLLAIIGVGLSWRQWRDVALLWFLQISMTGVYVIFHPSTRYRVPTDPLLFIFSAYALLWMLQLILRHRGKFAAI